MDVPDGSTHQPGIDWVADMGITQGCGDGTKYCPDQPVTRGQMATFLHRMSKAIPTVEIHTAGLNAPHGWEVNEGDPTPHPLYQDGPHPCTKLPAVRFTIEVAA